MKIFIIGTGNVATALGRAIVKAGHQVTGILGRDEIKTLQLARQLKCKHFTNAGSIPDKSEIYILALKDDVIKQVAELLPILKGIVVHTSGSSPVGLLNRFPKHGVFYPVETITKGSQVSFRKVPLCLEASDDSVMKKLMLLSKSLSDATYVLDSSQRAALHVAAVFTNNFTNYLLGVANDIIDDRHLPASLLKQLALSTVKNVFEKGSFVSQTGPAVRNDSNTISKHIEFLKTNKDYQQLYRLITNQIRRVHNKRIK